MSKRVLYKYRNRNFTQPMRPRFFPLGGGGVSQAKEGALYILFLRIEPFIFGRFECLNFLFMMGQSQWLIAEKEIELGRYTQSNESHTNIDHTKIPSKHPNFFSTN